jgi:hypothetical protein
LLLVRTSRQCGALKDLFPGYTVAAVDTLVAAAPAVVAIAAITTKTLLFLLFLAALLSAREAAVLAIGVAIGTQA